MFSASRSPRLANKAVILTCLLALTSFLAGSWQARAQAATPDARSASAESLVRLGGLTPRKVKDGTAMRMDHYDPHNKLRLAIFVTPRDLAGQEKLIAEQQDKKSPLFHKWVTADEWNARFGPRVEDEQAVVDWAKSQGLTITNRFANRMIVDVEAESGTIEKALNLTINHYKVGDEVDFSNDRDPSIPEHLSSIVGGIFGLTSIERMKPANSHGTEARHPDYVPGPVFSTKISGRGEGDPSKAPWAQESGTGKGGAAHGQAVPVSEGGSSDPNPPDELGGINPSNLYSSQGYDLGPLMSVSHCCNVHNDSTGSPADTSIALVTFGGFNYSDYTAFTKYYGMAWNIDAYQIDGAASPSTTDCQIDVNAPSSSCPGDGLDDEADLDVEWSTAFANSYGSSNDTAHVYVYEGSTGYFSNWFDTWNYVLTDAHAHVISSSYDWTEEYMQSGDAGWMTGTVAGDAHYIFNALVAAGNTVINSSGDQGSTSGCSNANQVFWPTDDPDVLSAGGTSLSLNYDGSFGKETAWVGGSTLKNCQSNGGGGGGGISQYFSAPSWQSGITYEEMYDGGNYIVSDQPNRMIPDMSLNATGNFQWDYCTTLACQNDGADGWATWGGTSIVAPELAGFFVQVNSYLNAIGHICGSDGTAACEPIGNPDPTLYNIGKHAGDTNYEQHYPFYDTNQLCVTNYLTSQNKDLLYFCATDGYDLATGWGSANLMQLAWAFNWWIIPSYGDPTVTFNDKPTTNHWYNTDQEVSWTVTDGTFGDSTTPASGVAGFTQGWDSLPADPTSEPNGGAGNAFYSGPQYPLGTTGCLSFDGLNGCAAQGVGQGCHTVQVRGWDNQGYANTYTYGPLCYDTVVPTIAIANSPASSYTTWVNKGVQVTLSATDPGGSGASGIYKTYYAIDTDACYPGNPGGCSVYTGPFTVSTQGQHYIWYFTEDNAGNYSTETYEWISIDLSTPVTSLGLAGNLSSGVYYSKVTATLSATDSGGSGIAATYYLLDGGVATKYTAPLTVSSVGSHTILYWSVNGAGTTEGINTSSFAIGTIVAPTLTSPSPGSILLGPTVTFAWSTEPGATGYYIQAGTTGVGSDNLINSAERTSPSYTSSSIPTTGVPVYVRVITNVNGTWAHADYTYTAATQAAMTTPATGSVLAGPTVTFNWATAAGSVTGYYLQIGSTGVGSSNILNSSQRTTPSYTISTMPTNGEPIYVRLITNFSGPWAHYDYVYTAATEAQMTSPALNSVLAGPTATFTWSAAAGATGYYLQIGNTGAGSDNIYNSAQKTVTSYTFTGLPTNGEPIYVRLITNYNGPWVHIDYTYTAATQAEMTAPAQGSLLSGPLVSFTWSAATGATGYYLQIGSTGAGSDNIYNSSQKTVTSYTFSGMPTNGEPIYVRLTTNYGGQWVHIDYIYEAATQASITSPASASVLPGPVVTFDWSAAAGATGYYIQIGSTGVGSSNIYNSSQKTTTSYTTTTMPTNGEPIYVRLITNYGGQWVHVDTAYTAASAAAMISPTPASTFTGASVPFTWSAATGATGYYLQIGSTGVGSDDIYDSAQKTVTSYTFTHMPTNGEPVYVRLITNYNGTWVHTDYTYTAE